MYTRNSVGKPLFNTFLALLFSTLASCGFCARSSYLCDLSDQGPVSELTSSDRNVVFENPGTIIAYHGTGCAKSNKSGTEDVLKVEESLELPRYATNATVFLNGWRSNYLDGDHHLLGLGTVISNITREDGTLKWQAAGILSDGNFDDGYDWCYSYTVIAWNSSNVDVTVDHVDVPRCEGSDEAKLFTAHNDGADTALSVFPSFLMNPVFGSSQTVAILPRGFGFAWRDTGFWDALLSDSCDGTDHHLLQIACNLDHSEIFVEKGKTYRKGGKQVIPLPANEPSASRVGSGYVSWETAVIFKDDDSRRDYEFGEVVSGLGGADVGVIQPPFSILPVESNGWGSASLAGGAITEEFVIENIPYEYAIPMLTGWELRYRGDDDEHVADIGTWIDEFHYDKAPGAPVGTLRYKLSSVLADEDTIPEHAYSHKVTILGIKPVPPRVTTSGARNSPDKMESR